MNKLYIIVCDLEEVQYFSKGVETKLFNSPLYEHARRKIMDASNKLGLDVRFVSAYVFSGKSSTYDIGASAQDKDIIAVVSPLVFLAPSKRIEDALSSIINNEFTYATVGSAKDLYGVFGFGEMLSSGYEIGSCNDFITAIRDSGAVYNHRTFLETEKATPASRMEYFKKIEEYRNELLDYFIMSGVDIENRDGIILSPSCVVRTGTKILPNTQIYGSSLIKENSIIGPNTIISQCEIGEDCVLESCKISDSTIGDDVTVKCYSSISNNCHIENGVLINSACVIENSYIEEESTIYSNAVIDEARIGKNAIVGPNVTTVKSVTEKKERKTYQCRIGANAVIGGNSTLITPVEIGENGLVAAGSVITDNVPSNHFAIAREFQENKTNAAKRRKRF